MVRAGSLAAIVSLPALGLVATGLPVHAAGDTVLSTAPAVQGGFGIADAIRDGEARRASAKGNVVATAPLSPRAEYAGLPVYVGTVGDRPVRLRIGPKTDARDSVHGEYSIDGSPGVRLLAGEYADGTFLMEESVDGTRVTGQWEGAIDATGAVRGHWFDPSRPGHTLPFMIRPLSVLVIPPIDMTPSSGVTYGPRPLRSSIVDGKPRQ